MIYTMEELREMANKLLMGNCRVVNLQHMKDVFKRYNKKVIEVEEGKYKLIKLWEV